MAAAAVGEPAAPAATAAVAAETGTAVGADAGAGAGVLQNELLAKAARFQTALHTANCIVPGLYLGSEESARDADALAALGVTHVLSVAPVPPPHPQRFTYCVLPINDVSTENLLAVLPDALAFIDSTLNRRVAAANAKADAKQPTASAEAKAPAVLLHCNAGVSRSGSLAVAFVMRQQQLPFEKALRVVQSRRSVLCPNAGFRAQLQLFAAMGFAVDTKHPLYVKHFAGAGAAAVKAVTTTPTAAPPTAAPPSAAPAAPRTASV